MTYRSRCERQARRKTENETTEGEQGELCLSRLTTLLSSIHGTAPTTNALPWAHAHRHTPKTRLAALERSGKKKSRAPPVSLVVQTEPTLQIP